MTIPKFENYEKVVVMAVSFAVALVIFVLVVLFSTPYQVERTDRLCLEYARRNHQKEIAPSRYEWLGKDFVDNFDWYKSCVNHTLIPVAK